MQLKNDSVTYEDFGATGDGVSDDLPAICEAHDYANEHGLSVRTRPDATYHLGSRALTATIATSTDWNTSRFTIDDTNVEDNKVSIFEVRSLREPVGLTFDRLVRDQKQVDVYPKKDCYVLVENDQTKRYIRRGLNQDPGSSQSDCFILRQDGSIEGAIDWNYQDVTRVVAQQIENHTLVLRGGVFTTYANRMEQEVGYNYWARNIMVARSNTVVDGLTHYVVGETATGHPYSGFLNIRKCAHITLRNCFVTGHKIYKTIGSAGQPVSMGSYDITAHHVVNFHMNNCRMNHICDRTRWGVIGTNHCKNILLENCTLSRMDTHKGVSGTYTVRGSTLGHMGLNAIGRGQLTVENSTLYGHALVNFRRDYGSTWEGDLLIRNCRWVPACGDTCWPRMIGVRNDSTHDFGYRCSMPREIKIDGLFVDDENHPDDYQGMYFVADPDQQADTENLPSVSERPFPYQWSQSVTIRELTTASGKTPQISPNGEMAQNITLIEVN